MRATANQLWIQVINRLRLAQQSEDGLTTTEVAVLTFLLVAIAGTVGTVLFQYATDTVNNAPAVPTFGS